MKILIVAIGLLGSIALSSTLATASTSSQSVPGVDAKTIKVAILDGDLKQLKDLGFAVEVGDTKGQWQAFIDDINARGGINGRKLVMTEHQSSVLNAASGQAACIAIAKVLPLVVMAAAVRFGTVSQKDAS